MKELKIIQNNEKLPNQLDFNLIFQKRQIHITNEEFLSYKRLVAGECGENIVMEYLEKYGNPNWTILRNIWLEHFGFSEGDIVVAATAGLHILEFKHYTGHFTYENSSCYVNGHKLKQNIICQTEKTQGTLKEICHELNPTIKVTGALIFTGPDCEVEILTSVNDIHIISRNQLKKYIQTLKDNDQKARKTFQSEEIVQHILKYQTTNPFEPTPLTPAEMNALRKGIYCGNCGSFDLEVGRKQYVICRCGYHESKEEAVVRTICEYGVLNYDKKLTIGEVYDFLGGQASQSYVFKILNKHFVRQGRHRDTFYENPISSLHQIKDDFEFELPKIQYFY